MRALDWTTHSHSNWQHWRSGWQDEARVQYVHDSSVSHTQIRVVTASGCNHLCLRASARLLSVRIATAHVFPAHHTIRK